MSSDMNRKLGGFQEAADLLTRLAGKTYTRQGIHQLWKRRAGNGFPDRKPWSINGHVRMLLDMQDVADWYAFPEAATVLSAVARKLYNSADVYHLWRSRDKTGFPDRKWTGERLSFDLDDVALWYRGHEEDTTPKAC